MTTQPKVPADWDDLRGRILNRAFYAHPPEDVAASTDLHADGYLDSMTVLVVLALFDEEFGEGVAVQQARIPDTTSLAAMEAFYQRLLGGD